MLAYSLYYNQHPGQLAPGLKIPGEIGAFAFTSPVKLLTCSTNIGARELAVEVWSEAAR